MAGADTQIAIIATVGVGAFFAYVLWVLAADCLARRRIRRSRRRLRSIQDD